MSLVRFVQIHHITTPFAATASITVLLPLLLRILWPEVAQFFGRGVVLGLVPLRGSGVLIASSAEVRQLPTQALHQRQRWQWQGCVHDLGTSVRLLLHWTGKSSDSPSPKQKACPRMQEQDRCAARPSSASVLTLTSKVLARPTPGISYRRQFRDHRFFQANPAWK